MAIMPSVIGTVALTSSAAMPTVDNPYKRPPQPVVAAAAAAAPTNEAMGPQSQRRLTLKGRTHQMQGNNNYPKKKLKAGDQQTLFGDRAFDPNQDCVKCKAKQWGRDVHRGHHPLCWNNRRTKGVVSTTTLESVAEEKRLKQHFSEPLQEKFSSRYATKETAEEFFTPRELVVQKATTTTTTITAVYEKNSPVMTPKGFCDAVTAKMSDDSFLKEFKTAELP